MSASYKLKRLALVLAISSAGVIGLNGCVAAVVGATAAGAGALSVLIVELLIFKLMIKLLRTKL